MTTKKLDHIAIAVRDLDLALRFYTEILGLSVSKIEEVVSENVRVAFLPIGDTCIELLTPLSEDSPLARSIEKRGEGLHHLCFQTDNLQRDVLAFREARLPLLEPAPRPGSKETTVAFLHPKANTGVLTEFVEYPAGRKPSH